MKKKTANKTRTIKEERAVYGSQPIGQKKLRFIDLFCGIGGFRIAFEKAGCECVFSCDWDKFSQMTYAANFGETPHGNIHDVAVADIPQFDILCAGFPCQPFSLAGISKKLSLGRKHGFEDEKQGNLFFDLAAIISFHQPPAFVLENVKHLQRHDQGRTFDIIYRTLTEELGYVVYHKIIDAQRVVPQHRERIFLVGFKPLTFPRGLEQIQSESRSVFDCIVITLISSFKELSIAAQEGVPQPERAAVGNSVRANSIGVRWPSALCGRSVL